MGERENRLDAKGYPTDGAPASAGLYQPVVVDNGVAYLSGSVPVADGEVTSMGKVPSEVSVSDAQKAAVKRHILYEVPEAPEGNAIEMEQAEFIRACTEGVPPTVTGEDGLAALRLATDILKKLGTVEVATGRD